MQLAVIDDLIQESKSQIEQSEPQNTIRENNKNPMCQVLLIVPFQAESISKADYEDFKAQINDLRMGWEKWKTQNNYTN